MEGHNNIQKLTCSYEMKVVLYEKSMSNGGHWLD